MEIKQDYKELVAKMVGDIRTYGKLKEYIYNVSARRKLKYSQFPKGFLLNLGSKYRTLKPCRILNYNWYTKVGFYCDLLVEDDKGIAIILIDRDTSEALGDMMIYNIPFAYNINTETMEVEKIYAQTDY